MARGDKVERIKFRYGPLPTSRADLKGYRCTKFTLLNVFITSGNSIKICNLWDAPHG